MSKEKDCLIRMRKLLTRNHLGAGRKIKKLSARVVQFGTTEDKEEMLRQEGKKDGLCYALKVLDKACQTEMSI